MSSTDLAPLLAAAALALAGCTSHDDPPAGGKPPLTGSVVFGVTGDLRPGVDFDRLHAVLATDGATTSDRWYAATASNPLAFPVELWFEALPSGTRVAVTLEAFVPGAPATAPLLVRQAATAVVGGYTLLDRVSLQSSCVPVAPGHGDAGAEGGPAIDGPPCDAALTCVDGWCQSPYVDPQFLAADPYTPDWAKDRPDPPCKPVLGQTPELVVGAGQADYAPIDDLAVQQVESGPQGGHHVWIALRAKNLHRLGTRTVLRAVEPTSGLAITPYETIFSLEPDEGGWCKLYGLRFQLDAAPLDVTTLETKLLGRELDVTATATDTSGDTVTATRRITLSATYR